MKPKPNSLRSRSPMRLHMERLESRQVMATFGIPWPEPRSLSVSFPTDEASIGAWPNSLRSSLGPGHRSFAVATRSFTSISTWASVANINIGLVPDRGDDLGAVGLTHNDPRFGEFRVGAFPQGATLANAAPFNPVSGTWSGDILLNSDVNYFLGDWNSSSPITVPAPQPKWTSHRMFSVLLHEPAMRWTAR